MKHLKFLIHFFAILVMATACGSKDGGGSGSGGDNVDSQSNRTFYESNGVCFRASTNERVNNSNCDELDFHIDNGECRRNSDNREVGLSNCTGNTYFISDSDCYDRSGDQVDDRRCTAGDQPASTGGRQRVCEGPHLQFTRDDILEGNCDGVRNTGNCSGAILFDLERQEWAECL